MRCPPCVGLVALWGLLLVSGPAAAESELDNECVAPGGQGESCVTAANCSLNAFATLCVETELGNSASRSCQIPCEVQSGANVEATPSQCSMGETCVQGRVLPGRVGYYCQPARFRMDLNLLDQCLVHFLSGTQPYLGSANTCSLERNLSQLLDQNADGVFNIFDMDLCVLAFLAHPECDANALTDADGGTRPGAPACDAADLTFCLADDECGRGLYCDLERHVCLRECGVIASRETSLDVLERQCTGALKSCNFERGRCEAVSVEGSTCQVDADCPSGAYCFLGECAPNCYRSIDCPGARWYCTVNNKCRALPPPAAEGFSFDPKNYAIRFGRKQLDLDDVQTSDSSPIVILDLLTKREVRNNPSVSFGYRLEIKYDLKQDTKCFQPFVDCSDPSQRPELSSGIHETEAECNARQSDCIIADTEEWIRPLSPFGTVLAQGSPRMVMDLEQAVAERLSPGLYSATVNAIFDNGDSHSIRVLYNKVTPSGEYTGNLTVYMHGPENALNPFRPIKLALKLKVTEELRRWNEIVQTEAAGNGFEDVTQGYLVNAVVHGDSSFAFAASGALTSAGNEIPFVGLYSPDLGRLRLIGLIDVDADFCIDESGASCSAGTAATTGSTAMRVTNVFGRDIRRVVEFFGPFDEATRRYHGIYREKISGLVSTLGGELTVEGGFILDQSMADESPVPPAQRLALPLDPAPVVFPATTALISQVNTAIQTYCAGNTVEKNQFASKSAYDSYRSSAGLTGAYAAKRVFADLVTFEAAVEAALGALGTDVQGQQAHLNIYDFLSSRILPCDPENPSPPPVCIEEDVVRCGLTLYQKALISGWTNVAGDDAAAATCEFDEDCGSDEVCLDGQCSGTGVGEEELFCLDTIAVDGCQTRGADPAACDQCDPALFTLQEHNRFWLNLAQIELFDGDKARSDAFFTLYRHAENPFAEGAALSYKEERLVHALERYDAIMRLLANPPATAVLWSWPMRDFKQVGNEWLNIMHSVAERRMSAIAEIVDLKRRVFLNASGSTRMLAQHLVQNEYLVQVYLMAMQEHWQKELFAYRGQAGEIFDTAQSVVLQLDPSRNPIGVLANQAFFENSNVSVVNWVNYKNVLIGEYGGGGLIATARQEIDAAVLNLKNSLSDLDTFEMKLRDARANLVGTLDEVCGNPHPPVAGPGGDYCGYLASHYEDQETWADLASCVLQETPNSGASCDGLTYLCSDYDHKNALTDADDCDQIVSTFSSTVSFEPACSLDVTKHYVMVHGQPRACVGGEMGALIREKAAVDGDREGVLGSLATLVDELEYVIEHSDKTGANSERTFQSVRAIKLTQFVINAVLAVVDGMYETTTKIMKAPDCLVVVGLAGGTDCAGHIASVVSESAFTGGIKAALRPAFEKAVESLDFVAEQLEHANEDANGELDLSKDLAIAVLQARGLAGEYMALTQVSFDIQARMEDLRYRAQAAADGYSDDVTFIAEHLVGRETGNLLVGNHLVQKSADRFRQILQYAYRLTQAFSYYYNLSPAATAQLANKVLAAVTIDDVAAFVEDLEEKARQYCGQEAIDCDSLTNIETLRFSVREQLFPNLRDIVDGRTGNVVTAGEQFHNLITQPPYLQRRIRGTETADQIELTISLPLTAKENTPVGPRWLIDPLSCNHQLAGAVTGSLQGGNIAANFLGRNLGDGAEVIRYELIRGNTDFLRACTPESIQEEIGTMPVLQYPIRTRIVGYAPQAEQAMEAVPPSYVLRSAAFPGCINAAETIGDIPEAGCWRYFARDRSLAAPDWKLVIPVRVGGAATDSTWVLGEGLPDHQRATVEDIVLYFRYRTRPIAEY